LYVRNYTCISLLTCLFFSAALGISPGCGEKVSQNEVINILMIEKQITYSPRTHDLDNNDNFSPDGRFLCYDTRATFFNENLANSKSIEKVEIATGREIVLWDPPSVTGEDAAPGVAAASYHPMENRVIFIHGPVLEEVDKRGYYGIRNRTAFEVDGEGSHTYVKVDMRDISSGVTPPGAHRGGTHRHEYSRDGMRIGFTYDDFLIQDYDRTIGFMIPHEKTTPGYTHYFALILKPAEKGKSEAGKIEKAYGDSWVDVAGTMRAFIGKVRARNGIDYENDLFVADIPVDVDITTSFSGTQDQYPEPPEGITIRRLTQGMNVTGIVRGSSDGSQIAFAAEDGNGIHQVFITKTDGSDKQPSRITSLDSTVSSIRWHPSGDWVFCISDGNLIVSYVGTRFGFGKTIRLSDDHLIRNQLVVSPDGNLLAYDIPVPTQDTSGNIVKDAAGNDFRQIFIMELDWKEIEDGLLAY
jgi:WD40 repeat protein